MSQAGQTTFGTKTGEPIRVSYDGFPEYKAGGCTIDWSLITAVVADTVLSDGTTVKAGDKYVRYGTPMVQVNVAAEVQTVDLSGGDDPTGGTFTITVGGTNRVQVEQDDGQGGFVLVWVDNHTTSALAFNASAAAVQAALEALENVEVGDVTVGKAGFVYTLTWRGGLGNVPQVTVTDTTLTGAASQVTTITTTTAGNTSGGKYAPADTSASNGQQTLSRGLVVVLNETVVQSDPMSDHAGGPITGGKVFARRLNVGGTNQVTLANLLTAMPRLEPVYE